MRPSVPILRLGQRGVVTRASLVQLDAGHPVLVAASTIFQLRPGRRSDRRAVESRLWIGEPRSTMFRGIPQLTRTGKVHKSASTVPAESQLSSIAKY